MVTTQLHTDPPSTARHIPSIKAAIGRKDSAETEREGHNLEQWLLLLKTELEKSEPDSDQGHQASLLQQLPERYLKLLCQELLPTLARR